MVEPEAPRVALIIPNYFDGDTILETLESVQENEAVEVIVVDDASPDPAVADKLRSYAERGLIDTLILRDVNEGASRAVNVGAATSRAPYICFFGNDDLLLPGALGALADALDADPGAAAAVGHMEFFGARTGLRPSAPWDPWRALTRNAWTGSMVVRRDFFDRIGGLTSELTAQDWDLYLSVASHGQHMVVLPRTVYRYRVHEHNRRLSATARKGYRDEARAVRRRHAELFARERELRRVSDAGFKEKAFWSLMLRLAPHRPPFLTDAFFHVTVALSKMRDAFTLGRSGA